MGSEVLKGKGVLTRPCKRESGVVVRQDFDGRRQPHAIILTRTHDSV